MYAKLENNRLIHAPKNYKTPIYLILNFNKNIELMEQYGFKKVVEVRPEYDYETQYLYVSGYTEDETHIFVNYAIKDIEPTIQEPTLEDRVSELEKVVEEQREFIEEQKEFIEKYKLLNLLK